MQRIQIGLSGLVGVLLLVGLANIVVDNVRTKDDGSLEMVSDSDTNATTASGLPDAKPSEPLAELGVTPAADSGMVADLQPDPALKERMDRPPPVTPTLPTTPNPRNGQ